MWDSAHAIWLSTDSNLECIDAAPLQLTRCSARSAMQLMKPLIFLILVSVSTLANAADVAIGKTAVHRGHTAVWLDPARVGEGYVLEVLDGGVATLTWFTYDELGHPRWLFAVGAQHSDASGEYLRFDELMQTSGAVFGDAFDPEDVKQSVVGSASIRFSTCDAGTISFNAFGQTGQHQLARLSRTMGASCSSSFGLSTEALEPFAGQSGSWFDLDHTGEGFQLQWSTAGQALLTWYTYDTVGSQFWLIGVGTRTGDSIHFPSLFSAKGGKFGSAFNPDDVELTDWGSLTLELNCVSGTASYVSTVPGFGTGSQELSVLTRAVPFGCPRASVKLQDLVSVEVVQLPPLIGDYAGGQVRSISDHGDVAGMQPASGDFRLLRLPAGGTAWIPVTDYVLAAELAVINPAGDEVAVSEQIKVDGSEYGPAIWSADSGLRVLGQQALPLSVALGASQRLTHIVGTGRFIGNPAAYPWIWNESGGNTLPLSEEVKLAQPRAASEDGDLVVGTATYPHDGTVDYVGVLWRGASAPVVVRDSNGNAVGPAAVCDETCSIVFGSDQPSWVQQRRREPWLLLHGDELTWLGSLSDAFLGGVIPPYAPQDASADGSLVVGSYTVAGPAGELSVEGYYWTRYTGIRSIRALLGDIGVDVQKWRTTSGVSISPSGEWLLVSGSEIGSGGAIVRKALVLRMLPN